MDRQVKDGLYTLVGLGVLSAQRGAVARRAAQPQLRATFERIDHLVDPVLDAVAARLPEVPGELLSGTRRVVRSGRRLVFGV